MFTGPNCSACKAMKPIIDKMDNAEIIDVTENFEKAREFNIRGGLPVFIKLVDGQFYDRMSGAVSENMLQRWSYSK